MHEALRVLDERIDSWMTGFFYILPNLVVAIIVTLFFLGLAYITAKLMRSAIQRAGRQDLGYLLASFAYWGVLFFGFLVVITILLPSMKPADIFTSLGIGSVALGFAFKDILQNWLAGVFILIRRPFHRGDQIKVGEIEGTVQAVETRATLLKTFAGKLVIIPNTDIYTNSVTVYTAYEIRRVEISVPVGMRSDLDQVIKIFGTATGEVEHVLADPPVDVLPWELRDNNVHLRVRWWTKSQRSYEVRTRAAVVGAIKRAADQNNIDIPADDTISFNPDTPLYLTERKQPKKPPVKAGGPKPETSQPPKDDIDEIRLDEPRDPEAEKPQAGELNEGLAEMPR
jgi:small-conductance mechanosensitive channel